MVSNVILKDPYLKARVTSTADVSWKAKESYLITNIESSGQCSRYTFVSYNELITMASGAYITRVDCMLLLFSSICFSKIKISSGKNFHISYGDVCFV